MNENQNPKQVQGIAFFISILFTFIFITEYCVHNRFAGTGEGNVVSNGLFNIYLNIYPKLLLLKFMYIVVLAGAYYVATTKSLNKGEDKENELYYHVATVSLIALFFLGFLKFSLYDILIYPIVFISMVYFLAKSINTFSKPTNKSSDILGGISQKPENDMSLVFNTDKGKMVVHKPQQGMYVEGGAGAGKCLVKGTKVVLFDGTLKNVEDVNVGEELMGIDSQKRTVLNLSSGVGMLYKVKQSKGEDYVVNENHILSLRKIDYVKMKKGDLNSQGVPTKNKRRYNTYPDFIDMPIIDFMNSSAKFKRCFLGYRVAIEFEYKLVTIDPYFLGLWLGDGTKTNPSITTGDIEIMEYVENIANSYQLHFKKSPDHNHYNVSIVAFGGKGHGLGKKGHELINPLQKEFLQYNLINNKHIPQDYIQNSKEVRLQLLAGLLDTDGNMDKNCFYIIQKSKALAEQIQFLAASLGFRTTFKEKSKSIKSIGFRGTYYEVSISGYTNIIPVRLDRKMVYQTKKNKNPFINSLKVEEYGMGEYFGFELDGDHRFLLKDCTVTHNSASVIEPAIQQFMEKNFTGIIYDWKGNPEPTLGKTAYSAQLLRDAKKDLKLPEGDRKWSQVAFISFTDLTRSTRCNPIHPDNLTSVLFATEIANIIMTTLKKEWLKKKDFWADNGIAVIGATIWMLKKHRPDYCDIPHMVGLLLTDLEACMNWMATDEEIGMMMQPIVSAYKKEASGQIAGVEASAQLPITKLFTAEISWVLSANDLNLDLNNMDNPTMLCISNDSVLKSALSPIISTIIMVCLNKMNVKGKQRSCLCVDELPTIYIPDLDMIPATARSNKVVTLLAAQLFNQIEDMYGKTLSDVILGNLGTQFFGMSNLQKTGDYVEKMLGEYKKLDTSTSENDQGGSSTSESFKNEKVMVARDVMSQPTGHFTGKVADGDPPFFSVQMAEFKMEKQDIPPFYVPVETGNPKLNKEILMKMAEDNHLKIIRECRELLTPYIKIPEDKNAREEY